MKFIATDVSDTREKMVGMASAQLEHQGFAVDSYFYRSHVTYEAELENIIFTHSKPTLEIYRDSK